MRQVRRRTRRRLCRMVERLRPRDGGARLRLPFIIAGWVARYVPMGGGPLLDAGCGTGLSGPYSDALGYDEIAGLDFSEKMLALRQPRRLSCAEAGSARRDAALAGRVFRGVPVDRRLHRRPRAGLRPPRTRTHHAAGGHAIFTVRDTVLEQGGFRDVFEWLEKAETLEAGRGKPALPGLRHCRAGALVKAFVFEVL